MIDIDDLKTFAKLPPIFTAKIFRDIQDAINDYDSCRACIVSKLEYYGDDAYKNPDAYTNVEYDVLNGDIGKLPSVTERRLLAVIKQMKFQNCKQ